MNNFVGEMILFCAKSGNSVKSLSPEINLLWSRYQSFLQVLDFEMNELKGKGSELNYLPDDHVYQLFLCSLSFFSPSSVNYAGMLNEIGRYLQGKQISSAIGVYQKSIELFESNNDYVNCCLVMCNLAKLIHLVDLNRAYNCLLWMNSHIDSMLMSSCNQKLKQSVLISLSIHVDPSRVCKFVRSRMEIEKSKSGPSSSTVVSMDKIRCILNYCMNALDVVV